MVIFCIGKPMLLEYLWKNNVEYLPIDTYIYIYIYIYTVVFFVGFMLVNIPWSIWEW